MPKSSLASTLLRIPRFGGSPAGDASTTLLWGKHRGKTFQQVYDTEPSYVVWCASNLDGQPGLS
jgi:hypothetical protein